MAGVVRTGRLTSREPTVVPAAHPAPQENPDDVLRSPETTIDGVHGDLSAALPEGTVLLRVVSRQSPTGDSFVLELQSAHSLGATAEQNPAHQRRPQITLAATATSGDWAGVLTKMRGWSANKRPLRQWLSRLHSRYGQQLRMIVWDDTGFQIPWELFYHDSDDASAGSYGWLGTAVELIRWTEVYTEEPVTWSTGGATVCRGGILSFVDPQFLDLGGRFGRWAYEPASSMAQLMRRLDDSNREVGLVQVWAHGTVAGTGSEATMGGLSMDDMNMFPLKALGNKRTFVLLNTCSGAELMNDERFGEIATRSFAEIFLRRGARGVIATSGPIAKIFFLDLLDHLLGAQDNLSAALRTFRAALAADLPEFPPAGAQDVQAIRDFVYGSMVQYIGHLDTSLRLHPPSPPGVGT